MNTSKLRITGMTCDRCESAVEGALSKLPGVHANSSFADGIAQVTMTDKTPVDTLVKVIMTMVVA